MMSGYEPQFDVSGAYRICIIGRLDERWSDRIGGMTIETVDQGAESAVTILSGCLPDQAALLGVLNTLFTLHLPLLLVEYIGSE